MGHVLISGVVGLYIAFVLRIVLATQFNDFRRRVHRVLFDEKDERRAHIVAKLSLFLLAFLWPVYALFYPKLFINAFILNRKGAVALMSFVLGHRMGVMDVWLREFSSRFRGR